MQFLKFFALGILFPVLLACNTADSNNTTNNSITSISGVATKGFYQQGSSVEVYQLINGQRSASPVARGTVTDNLGSYSVNIPTSMTGPFEILITGNYLDETTGNISNTSQPTSLVFLDTGAVSGKANINPVTSIQTALLKQKLISAASLGTPLTTGDIAQEINTAGVLALQTLGISTVDANGTAVDPTQLDLLNATDPAVGGEFLVASAIIADLINTGSITDIATFANNVASDIFSGNPMGTTSGIASAIDSSINTVQAQSANIVNNLDSAAAAAAATTNISAADASNAANDIVANPPTQLQGFALQENTLTIGGVAATVTQDGTFTASSSVAKNNVNINMTLKDFNGPAQTISTALTFDIEDVNGPRSMSGSISPVEIITDGTGNIVVTIPLNAILIFQAVDVTETTIAGQAENTQNNNIPFDTIINTDAAGVTNINANILFDQMLKKANINQAQLDLFGSATTLNCSFGIGANIGLINNSNDGMQSLFPLSNNPQIAGRAIHGLITIN